jgi:hypothetical protein
MFNRARLAFAFHFTQGSILRRMSGSQVPPQSHKQGNRYAHYDQRTDTQDQEPPDHPHNCLG